MAVVSGPDLMKPRNGGDALISAQKVLFCTLFIVGFEHFLCTNQCNQPNWHIKVPAILLIAFFG